MRVGVNGMGRIGRLALRAALGGAFQDDDGPRAGNRLDVVHVNELKGAAAATAHLLEFNSVHGRWRERIGAEDDRCHGRITTIHDPTNTSVVVDAPRKDLRRARSATLSLQPTTTGTMDRHHAGRLPGTDVPAALRDRGPPRAGPAPEAGRPDTSRKTTVTVTIYHNPACRTSRNVLALIRNSGEEPTVVEYLKTPPGRDELADLIRRMGVPVREVLRCKGTPFDELGLGDPSLTNEQLLDAMAAHPILINRPIVITPLGVRLCRPSEAVLDILPNPQRSAFAKEDGERVADAQGRRVAGGDAA